MKSIKLTKERVNEILPDNVKNSNVVSENAKRVLAALLNHYYITPKAVENYTLTIGNTTLRASSGIKMNSMLAAVQELIELSLITRVRGKRRVKNEKAIASEYRFNIENINTNPIVRPTPEELLMRFFKVSGTAYTNTVTNTNSDSLSDTQSDTESLSNTESLSDTQLDTQSDKNNLLYSDHNDQLDNKENILNNKINIIDNITVCEGEEPSSTESDTNNKQQTDTPMSDSNNSNNQQDIIPACAESAYAKPTLRSILTELCKCTQFNQLKDLYTKAEHLIGDNTNGRVALLQLTHDMMAKNNINVDGSELLEADGKMSNLRELLESRPSGPTLLRRITRLKPLVTQLLIVLPNLTNRLMSEEDLRAWYKSLPK